MSVENQAPMGLDRKEIDNKILDELHDGRNVPSNLAEELDVSRQYISQRLKLLEAADYVENVGRGVYQLLDDPRPDTTTMDPQQNRIATLEDRVEHLESELEVAPDQGELKGAISELEDACERGDRADVETAMEQLRTAAGVGPE